MGLLHVVREEPHHLGASLAAPARIDISACGRHPATYYASLPHEECGIVMNFYADDPDRPGTYSCRGCMAVPVEAWHKVVSEWSEEHKDAMMNPHLVY